MDDDGHEPGRDRDGQQPILGGDDETAEQLRAHVVAVPPAGGRGLAFEGMGVERLPLERRVDQLVGGDQRRDRRGGRSAEPGAQRDALVDLHLEAESQPQSVAQREQRAAGRVARRVLRQLGRAAADRRDADRTLVHAAHRHLVARSGETLAQDVEADGDVADRGRGEGGGLIPAHPPDPRAGSARASGVVRGAARTGRTRPIIPAPRARPRPGGDRRTRPPRSPPARPPAPRADCGHSAGS